MNKALAIAVLAAGVALAAPGAQATTVTSNTIPSICNAEVTIYGSPAVGGQVTIYRGALNRGGITLEVYPSQGTQICYTRSSDPANCSSPMTAPVCAPVTGNTADVLDIH